ncbi:MAG TPA: hypothetical protein VKZ41_01430 [Gemmatimonadales bacterium]|nr:hypothetical protein [Gemmatimonadales bacterium]
MKIRTIAGIALLTAMSLSACGESDTPATNEALQAAPVVASLPVYQAPPVDGTVEQYVEWFVREEGYVEQDVALVDSAIDALLSKPEPGGLLRPGADITPPGKAVLVVEARDQVLPRTRYRVRYGAATAHSSGAGARPVLSFVQVDRFSLEQAVMASYAGTAAEPYMPGDTGRTGPHVSYRLVMHATQGSEAQLVAISRREIADTSAARETCNGVLCMHPAPEAEDAIGWEVMEEVNAEFTPAYERSRNGMLTPTAALELALAELGAAWLDQGRIVWRGFEERESVIPGLSFVEAVIETGLGQDDVVEAWVREGDVMDDDVLAVWQWIVTLPQPSGAAPATYGARAYERRMRPE